MSSIPMPGASGNKRTAPFVTVMLRCCLAVVICLAAVPLHADSVLPDDFAAFDPGKTPVSDGVEDGLTYLLGFCASDKTPATVDLSQLMPVVDFIRSAPEMADADPRPRRDTQGSFIAYTLNRTLGEVLRYAYNPRIPEGAINASSVSYARWLHTTPGAQGGPDLWKMLGELDRPKVVTGVARETISPDLHTGAYYAYDLRRALLLLRTGTTRVMISISNQLGDSDVGRKGYIIGDDQDWNYLYTQDKGLNKAGLGWVKSRIYNFFSICCYIEDSTDPGKVKIGVFQWLRAGWAGFNLVESRHIRKGMERYASQFKALLESKQMPAASILEGVYNALSRADVATLREKASVVARFLFKKARQDEALKKNKALLSLNAEAYVARMDKDQLISGLMREFIKYSLGKETPLKPSFWLAIKASPPSATAPLS